MRQRPFFLSLLQIRLPIGAVVSILHRACGAVLSLLLPCLLYILMLSLRSPEDFQRLADAIGGLFGWLLSLILAWAVLHHFLAGLRHLGFDLGWGEEKERARLTAWASLFLAIGLSLSIVLWKLK